MTSEDIRNRIRSRWFWREYLRKKGLMRQPKPFNREEYAERWLKELGDKSRIRMSTGNRYRIIRDSGGREAMEYVGNQNYYDPAFDVS